MKMVVRLASTDEDRAGGIAITNWNITSWASRAGAFGTAWMEQYIG